MSSCASRGSRGVNVSMLSEMQEHEMASILLGGSRQLSTVCVGSALTVVVASLSPDYLLHSQRVQSFSGRVETAAADQWARSGFHSDSRAGAICCHCGVGVDRLGPDPAAWHMNQRPDCRMMRLVQVLRNPEAVLSTEASAEARKLEALIRSLLALRSQPVAAFVESFGFSAEEVSLSLWKYLVASGLPGCEVPPPAPGVLVRLAQSLPEPVRALGRWIVDLARDFAANFLTADGVPPAPREDALRGTPILEPNARAAAEAATKQQLTAPDGDSPLCQRCKRHQMDRVLLPCAHLKFCRSCTAGMRNCQHCGSAILADRPAFLT